MAFSSLPTEILDKIAIFCSLKDEVDTALDEFRHRHKRYRFQVACNHDGLAPLASVDVRRRAICLPILFSHISIRLLAHSCTPEEHSKLLALEQMLISRPHISRVIQSISIREVDTEPVWLEEGDSVVLTRILGVLPNITSLSGLTYTNSPFIDTVIRHPCLTSLDIFNDGWKPHDIPDNRDDGYYRKLSLRAVSTSKLFPGLVPDFEAAMRLGLSIESLKIDVPSDRMHDAIRLCSPSLTSVEIDISDGWRNEPTERFPDWLSTLILSCVNLHSIQFRRVWKADSCEAIPFLGELDEMLASSPEMADDGDAFVIDFAIVRRVGDEVGSFSGSQIEYLWSEEWRISSLYLGMRGQVSIKKIPAAVSAGIPNLASLILVSVRMGDDQRTPFKLDAENASDALRGFHHLREVAFHGSHIMLPGNLTEGDEDDEDYWAQWIRPFAMALKDAVPSLQLIYGTVLNQQFLPISYICGFRNRLLVDGTGYEAVVVLQRS